jgi:type IV pilus assembly protein PilW
VALLTDVPIGTSPSPCILESVASTFTYTAGTTLIPLAGTYHTITASPKGLGSFSEAGLFENLGQAPMMQVFGVGNNTTLFSYDILQGLRTGGANTGVSQALASGVFQMKALYAIDTSTTGNGTAVSWVSPATAPWDFLTLTNGSAASILALQQIKAVRLGLVMRTQLPENVCPTGTTQTLRTSCTVISQTAPVLFNGVLDANGNSLAYTVTLSAADKVYRYKTFETTIPMRNNLIPPQT